MTQITLDIETVPSQMPGARDQIRASIKPPGTLKKAESIAAWWMNDSESAVEEAFRKQSLDGGLHGEIISIAALYADRHWVSCRAVGESESELLHAFFNAVENWQREDAAALLGTRHDDAGAWPQDPPHPVAHNAPFDLGFLWRRARVLGVPVPTWLPGPLCREGRDFTDTMTLWAGRCNRVGLAALCRALSVPTSKGDLDGSQVLDAWLRGETERIAKYNLADVVATRDVWQRLQGGAA